MTLGIHYSAKALKDLTGVGHVAQAKIMQKIEDYAQNPAAHANMVKKLKGVDALRLRVGDYRVLFTESGVVMGIIGVGHRKDIYD